MVGGRVRVSDVMLSAAVWGEGRWEKGDGTRGMAEAIPSVNALTIGFGYMCTQLGERACFDSLINYEVNRGPPWLRPPPSRARICTRLARSSSYCTSNVCWHTIPSPTGFPTGFPTGVPGVVVKITLLPDCVPSNTKLLVESSTVRLWPIRALPGNPPGATLEWYTYSLPGPLPPRSLGKSRTRSRRSVGMQMQMMPTFSSIVDHRETE